MPDEEIGFLLERCCQSSVHMHSEMGDGGDEDAAGALGGQSLW